MPDRAHVLVLEGLPCCGKSRLARRITSTFNTNLCPEIITKTRHHLSLGRAAAQDNDYLKYQLIHQSTKPILVDRYFYSTIAYEAAILSEPLNTALILKIAAELDVQKFAANHTVIIWRPDINSSLNRVALDKYQSRSSIWRSRHFIERFAKSYYIIFDRAVTSLLTPYCSNVIWVEDRNAFEIVSHSLGFASSCFD